MSKNAPLHRLIRSKAPIPLATAAQRMVALNEQGRYQESLEVSLQIVRTYPGVMDGWNGVAANYIHSGRWQDVIRYAHAGLARRESTFGYDALALAHGMLGQRDEMRHYGLQALDMRARENSGDPVIPLPEPNPLPPLPSTQTRQNNVIAFSLFGSSSKYCEPAVLNVQEQPRIYPHWVCRFYVDDSVPASVIARLRAGGGQVVPVTGDQAQWPGTMWRLLALDDPQAHRILFRDADSVISQYEANAVDQWLTSGKRFHMMRDWCSHTELILAGLWGVVGGSLPPLEQLVNRFMSVPLASRHYADQFFLRQYVWPYARTSLMQHDSIFGFMGGVPFPDKDRPEGFHVGCWDSAPKISIKSNLPDGSKIVWELYRTEKRDGDQAHEELICAYPGIVKSGTVRLEIPARYVQWIQQGAACIRTHSGQQPCVAQ